MRAMLLVGLLLSARVAVAAPAGEMTPERIREAIAKGSDPGYVLKDGQVIFGILSTPWTRVASAAKKARETYRPFTEADVTPEMIAPEVSVTAYRQWTRFGSIWKYPHTIVIAPKGKAQDAVIHASNVRDTARQEAIVATFPLSALIDGYEIRAVYDGPVCGGPECGARIDLGKIR